MTRVDKKVIWGSILALLLVVSLLAGYVVGGMQRFAPISESIFGTFP